MKKLTLKIDDSPETKQRKRMCLNCRYRTTEEASDFCRYKGRYMHYDEVFEGWCPHWSKDRTAALFGRKITDDAYNALNKIATATKADCWFYIEDRLGLSCVRDLEYNGFIGWRIAIQVLIDSMVEPVEDEFYKLTKPEIDAFCLLIEELELTDYYKTDREL